MTVSRDSLVTKAPETALMECAEAVASAAADHLELPLPEFRPNALDLHLDNLRQRLEWRIAELGVSEATAGHLVAVLRMQCALLDDELFRRLRSLSEVRNALGGLRGLSPRDMIQAAPMVLSREFEFARTMISTVKGSLWLPQQLFIQGGVVDPESQRFSSFVDGAQFQLASAPLETELVRKRCGALVSSPASDKRTFKEIVEVSGCFGYVAAPIIVQGRAIGMLHADRPGQGGRVIGDHLDQLEAFAECLSVAFESAVLEAKAAQQRAEVGNLCAGVEGSVYRSEDPADGQLKRRHPEISSLTAREREIMEHVSTGATNSQIARYLVISEGTVKSHLKHIAKKLNTPSRAAAVAVYSGLAGAAVSR